MRTAYLQTTESINVTGHLEERRGIYHVMLKWTDRNGKHVRKCFTTGLEVKGNKKRAEDLLFQLRCEFTEKLKQDAEATNPAKMLFADLMEQWLAVIKPDIEITTFAGYEMNVTRVIAPYFRKKGVRLKELTAADINYFYSEQLNRVSGSTVQHYHANIHSALKYALANDLMTASSILGKIKRPKASPFVGQFLSQSEVVELFEKVRGHKLELGVILGAFYGLRRSEIVGLRWDAIDFESNTITIRHTVAQTTIDGKKTIVERDRAKTKSSMRTLPLVPEFKAKLLAIKKEQEKNRRLCGRSYNTKHKDYIYVDALGNRIAPDCISAAFPKFMERNGLRKMRFHDLRHSCASLLLANGVSLKQIQEWLGHSTFNITADIYAHLDYSSKQKSADSMTWLANTSLATGCAD